MPPQQIFWIVAGAIVILGLAVLSWLAYRWMNVTTYRQYNHQLGKLERKLDINLSLKKIRFKNVSPVSLTHVRKNIDNITLANNAIRLFHEVYKTRGSKKRSELINAISVIPDIMPFYDARKFRDSTGWKVSGDIMRHFITKKHLATDPIIVKIMSSRRYERRNFRFYFAYSGFFVSFRIHKGFPEVIVTDYDGLDYIMKRLGKKNEEGHRIGNWSYRFVANHDRIVVFYKKVIARKLSSARLFDNIYEIVENRDSFNDCQSIHDAMVKVGKIQNLNEVTLTEIDRMSGPQFQDWCQDALEAIYGVPTTKLAHDPNVDFILEGNAKVAKTAVLVFRQERPIGASNIQAVQKACFLHDADKGMIITNGEFTKSARDLAIGTNISLMSRENLIELINKNNVKVHS